MLHLGEIAKFSAVFSTCSFSSSLPTKCMSFNINSVNMCTKHVKFDHNSVAESVQFLRYTCAVTCTCNTVSIMGTHNYTLSIGSTYLWCIYWDLAIGVLHSVSSFVELWFIDKTQAMLYILRVNHQSTRLSTQLTSVCTYPHTHTADWCCITLDKLKPVHGE